MSLERPLPHEVSELQFLSNIWNNDEFRKLLPKFKKEYFEKPEHRVVFEILRDHLTEFNEPPTKADMQIKVGDVSFGLKVNCSDDLIPAVQHAIDGLWDKPDNTELLIHRAQQLYVQQSVWPELAQIDKDTKAGKAIDLTRLEELKAHSFKEEDEGDRTKLKMEAITHHYEQGRALAEQLKSPSYRIKHLLPESGVGVFTGPSGTGKTFAIDHLIAHLITGRKYFGKRVKPCNVLYVYAEGNANDIELRLEAHVQHYGNDDFNTEHHRLSIAPCIWNLCDESIIQEIIDYITKHDIKFVVLETLGAMLMDGTVNDDEVVRKYLAGAKKIADQCNCTLLIVHHPPKGGGSIYLGSVTIKNNPDFLWTLWKNNEEGDRDDDYKAKEIMLTLYCDKSKFAPDGWSFNLLRREIVIGIDDEGDETTSIVIENMTSEEVAEMIEIGKAKAKGDKSKFTKLTGNAKKLDTLLQDCFLGRDNISGDEVKVAAKSHPALKGATSDTIRHLAERGAKGLQDAGVMVRFDKEKDVLLCGKAAVVKVEADFSMFSA